MLRKNYSEVLKFLNLIYIANIKYKILLKSQYKSRRFFIKVYFFIEATIYLKKKALSVTKTKMQLIFETFMQIVY